MQFKDIEKLIKEDNDVKENIKRYFNGLCTLHLFSYERNANNNPQVYLYELVGDKRIIRSLCEDCPRHYLRFKSKKLDEKDIFTIKILLEYGTTN